MDIYFEGEVISFIVSIYCCLFYIKILQLVCTNILFKSNVSNNRLIANSQIYLLKLASLYWLKIILTYLIHIVFNRNIINTFSNECINKNYCKWCEIIERIQAPLVMVQHFIFILFLIEICTIYKKFKLIIIRLLQIWSILNLICIAQIIFVNKDKLNNSFIILCVILQILTAISLSVNNL